MNNEIDKGICACCGNNFPSITIHHLDGNHDNNRKDNLISVCKLCHSIIHVGFKKRSGLERQIIENIFQIRKILLIKSNNYSLKDAEDRIKYERALSSNYGRTKRCAVCGSLNNLKVYPPKFVIKFDKENSKGIGIAICNKCSENRKNIIV